MGMFSILAGGDLLVIVTLGAIRWVAVWIFWAGMFTSLVTSFEWSVLELIVFKVGAVELIEGLLKYKNIYYIAYKIYSKMLKISFENHGSPYRRIMFLALAGALINLRL